MSTMNVDEAKLEQFMGRMIGYMTGGAACFGIWLGDELGLYSGLSASPGSADQLAAPVGCNPRLVREWLDGQVAAGLVDYDPEADSYSLSLEATMALADETSPVFTARGMNAFGSMFRDIDKIKAAFTGDGGLAWGDHDACLFKGTEWFFRTGYRAYLPTRLDSRARRGAGEARGGRPSRRRRLRPRRVGGRRWPRPTRTRASGGSTSTRPRSRSRASGQARQVSSDRTDFRGRHARSSMRAAMT